LARARIAAAHQGRRVVKAHKVSKRKLAGHIKKARKTSKRKLMGHVVKATRRRKSSL
jgi:hypothetical protein